MCLIVIFSCGLSGFVHTGKPESKAIRNGFPKEKGLRGGRLDCVWMIQLLVACAGPSCHI